MRGDLTPGERKILAFAIRYYRRHGVAATLRDICRAFGWTSPNSAAEPMQRLVAKGRVAEGSPLSHRRFRPVGVRPLVPVPCEGADLTTTQARVLAFIASRSASGISPSQREIADHFGVNVYATQGILGRLEARGYIERRGSRGLRVLKLPRARATAR